MIAPPLPAALAPPAPFPLVIAQSTTQEAIAPGIRRGTYRLATSDGPLVVDVVAIDPNEPSVRLGSVLATDRLVSPGETVSSMARRTGAVAGINADYFDIGQTNQPLNVLVRRGTLVRTPSARIALDVRRDRSVHVENVTFSGTVRYGSSQVPLTAVDEWPPQGGVTFITPAFGTLRAAPGVTLATLVPGDNAHDAAGIDGSYRVAALAAGDTPQLPSGLALGFGPAALALASPPPVGSDVTVTTVLMPPLADLATAVGGGPLLVRAGTVADDPNAPAPEERDVRFPVAGALVTAAGSLVLATVDGRAPALSIGVTRPQFAALMLGLGARDALAFDSGGSATLVARDLGDTAASVQNVPSDGEERPVADGLFAYSDTPVGPPAALAVQPSSLVALPGIAVPVRAALVDAAGHAVAAAHLVGGDVVRTGAQSGTVTARAGPFAAKLPVRIVAGLARLDVASDVRVPDRNALVRLSATGSDASNAPVALGDRVRWRADVGGFVGPGLYRTAQHDARIVASAGGASGALLLRVGRHRVALPLFDAAYASTWQFASLPVGAPGSLSVGTLAGAGSLPALQLVYDFTSGERAAYANAPSLALPGEPLQFAVDVAGDGSSVGLRAAFVNRFGERRALTLAKRVDWKGWQTRTIVLPDDLNPPVRLTALYAVPSLGGLGVAARGTLGFRHPTAVIAGSP